MTADRLVRLALWASVPLNLLGMALFLSAAVGHPSPLLPLPLPPFYAAQLALVIGLFAGVYVWLARQPVILRPLLLVATLGKLGFFSLFVLFWTVGDLPFPSVVRASPDLLLGLIYAWWLWPTTTPRLPTATP